jgi:hypothetical protein
MGDHNHTTGDGRLAKRQLPNASPWVVGRAVPCAPRQPTHIHKFCLTNAAGIHSQVARFAFRSLHANRSHPCPPEIAPRARRARRISFHANKKQGVRGPWSVVLM